MPDVSQKIVKCHFLATKIKDRTQQQIKTLVLAPKLATVMIGKNAAVLQYAKSQQRLLETNGIGFQLFPLCCKISETNLVDLIRDLNQNCAITGIMVLLPLPANINPDNIHKAIAPEKDVEGVTPYNMGKLFYGDFSIAPCTAKAIWLLLQELECSLCGKKIVIISQSKIIGRPLSVMLLYKPQATLTCCHIETRDLATHTLDADIIVSAVGKPKLITAEMIKTNAIVIDVGMSESKEQGKWKLVGDVEENSVIDKVKLLAPVHGGIGAVTTAILLENIVTLAERQKR